MFSNPNPLSPGAFAASFGTGADGNVVISSGTVNLTREMHYQNLTISGTGSINTGCFTIRVAGTLDISAAPANAIKSLGGPGNAASGATAGGAIAGTFGTSGGAQLILGSYQANGGGNGATGAGANAAASAVFNGNAFQIGGLSGSGGNGGAAGSAGGTGATVASPTMASPQMTSPPTSGTVLSQGGNGTLWPLFTGNVAGCGGGGGGGDGTNAGGGGGGGGVTGGVVAIFARNILRGGGTAAGAISAKGGIGGAGANAVGGNAAGGGGGGGGGGGFVYVMAEQLLGAAASTAIDVSGGNGGAGGTKLGTGNNGVGGVAGNGGNYQVLICIPASFTAGSFNATPSAAPTGTTGGVAATIQGAL